MVSELQNFRDCHKDKLIRISSYALKSVVMNIILERPSKIWDRYNIQEHFLEVRQYSFEVNKYKTGEAMFLLGPREIKILHGKGINSLHL